MTQVDVIKMQFDGCLLSRYVVKTGEVYVSDLDHLVTEMSSFLVF